VRIIGELGTDELSTAGAATTAGSPAVAGAGVNPTGGTNAMGGVVGVTSGGKPSQTGGAATAAGTTPGGAAGDSQTSAGADVGGAGGESGAGGEPPELTAVPVAHLKLDECTGADAADVESSALGMRINVGCTDGVLGKAADFSLSPSGQRVELAEAARFDFTHELTVAAWVKPAASSAVGAIVGKWYGNDSFLLSLREVLDQDGHTSTRFAFSIAEPEGTWGRPADVISPFEVPMGVWSHVAGVYKWSPNGQVGHITLYVNGKPVGDTSTKVGTDGLQQSTRPVMIGFVEEYAPFVGAIDEVRLYNVALGPELAWLYSDPSHL
jgi:hypothetical protein